MFYPPLPERPAERRRTCCAPPCAAAGADLDHPVWMGLAGGLLGLLLPILTGQIFGNVDPGRRTAPSSSRSPSP